MYKFVRSGKIKGNVPEAVRWAKEIADYVSGKHSPVKVHVYTGMFGDLNTIFWEIEHKDLASIEALSAKLVSDQGYWAVVEKAAGLFIDGTFRDSVLGSV